MYIIQQSARYVSFFTIGSTLGFLLRCHFVFLSLRSESNLLLFLELNIQIVALGYVTLGMGTQTNLQ